MSALEQRLAAEGPKRLLAFEGGGVRGILSLTIAERIEGVLRQRSAAGESFRLSQYFDLVGGTSTGSIIASGLALGYSAGELLDLYRRFCAKVFRRRPWSIGLIRPRYSPRPLAQTLRDVFGDVTLGSDRLKTGLAIVTKRIDTGSVWILHNNPKGPFFAKAKDGHGAANSDIPLVSAILASTAAPTFFSPELIRVNDRELGAFVDGGVSPHNNPSLHLLMLANLEGYHFHWPLGAERLMLVSIGTGFSRSRQDVSRLRYMPSVFQAVRALHSMIEDGSRLAQTILQWAAETPTPHRIDSEMGDLSGDRLGREPLLHYLRYDAQLEIDWLLETLGITIGARELEVIRQIDDPAAIDLLIQIGRQIADRHVLPQHFPPAFNLAAANVSADGARSSGVTRD